MQIMKTLTWKHSPLEPHFRRSCLETILNLINNLPKPRKLPLQCGSQRSIVPLQCYYISPFLFTRALASQRSKSINQPSITESQFVHSDWRHACSDRGLLWASNDLVKDSFAILSWCIYNRQLYHAAWGYNKAEPKGHTRQFTVLNRTCSATI